jgi:anhydro-N-acetylmuramic acid kinase
MLTENYNVISVMSGTSLDGIDIIYANYKLNATWKFSILKAETVSYSEYWKQKLNTLTHLSKAEIEDIDIIYSNYLGNKILEFVIKHKIETIDFVSSHGHTALHNPRQGYTYQIGNTQILADVLKQKIICDFRVQDVELGGQGAPLVPIGDKLLFSDYTYCLNLGGFANISYDDNGSRIAYDICPANIVLNYFMKKLGYEFDNKGQLAQSGTIIQSLLEELNLLSYYRQKPPKSLGLEWVQTFIFPLLEEYAHEIKDILTTVVEHTAIQISKSLQNKTGNVLITGGGAYNLYLIERIKSHTKIKIDIPSKTIIEFKEALIFGLLGVLKVRNEVNCLSSVTGAKKDHSSGKIFSPKIRL